MGTCIYERKHKLRITTNYHIDQRNVLITITQYPEKIQMKMRDSEEFQFNYTADLDSARFEQMKREQNLEISYNELRTNILELLEQVSLEQMFLKGITQTNTVDLIFYTKSKIKLITYLIIQHQPTNQKVIFNEMNTNLQKLKETVNSLTNQLTENKLLIMKKQQQIDDLMKNLNQLDKLFQKKIDEIQMNINEKIFEISDKIADRLAKFTKKLGEITKNIINLQEIQTNRLSRNSKINQSYERIRMESERLAGRLNELESEKQHLTIRLDESDGRVHELTNRIDGQIEDIQRLNQLNDELKNDLKQANKIITQKTLTNDEMAMDLVQANQMIVNFNNCYNTKCKEFDDIKLLLIEKEKDFNQLEQRYDDYKQLYNNEEMDRLKFQLGVANRRVEVLEKTNKEHVKLNELLTKKLSDCGIYKK